ncbi:MAG: acyl transferase [Cytophagales bacterium]|nr:acyl transferase [Cytophagales bacterium]
MDFITKFRQNFFEINNNNFEQYAIQLFQYQSVHNEVYAQYLSYLKVHPQNITSIYEIPFLPIEFYKNHKVLCKGIAAQTTFESSGTTGITPSVHYVADVSWYEDICIRIFESYFGTPSQYVFVALLPNYLERKQSSLVHMVNHFMRMSNQKVKYYFLYEYEEAQKLLSQLAVSSKVILIGVTFALLEMSEKLHKNIEKIIIIETGGMKGRGQEMTREELHKILKLRFNSNKVYSEYGMTELTSQAYYTSENGFTSCPWFRVLAGNMYDPFQKNRYLKRGKANIIDLSNLYSCAFVETSDIVQIIDNEHFEILGRVDNAMLRGCSLLY